MKKDRFSLSRFLNSILTKGTPTGYELDISNELTRSLSPKWKTKRGEPGHLVPSSAFDLPATRDLTISGTGAHLVGKKVRQLPGLIGWSAVVSSGAQILGPFKDSDITVYHDSALPTAAWLQEIGSVTLADTAFASSVLSAKRIAAQVALSRQLLVQSVGNEALDEFIASRIRLVFSSRLDQTALYGAGTAANEPLGVVNTPGTNLVPVAAPVTWDNIADLRFASTNYDASTESFGFITSPAGRQAFEKTAKFAGGALSIWDTIKNETEISKQVNDSRIFAGIWNYLCVATWGAGTDEFATDLIVDSVTSAYAGRVIITGSMYCDVACRWPALLSYTAANAVP
jgi:hypothetical protein